MNVATQTKLDAVPLSRHIGAEIRGIDLRDSLDAEVIDAIHGPGSTIACCCFAIRAFRRKTWFA